VLSLHASDALVEKYRASDAWRIGTVVEDIAQWAARDPERSAIVAHRVDSGMETFSYGEFSGWVDRFAGALAELGVAEGDVVAMQLPNWWQAPALSVACWRLGAVVAPIMTTLRAREVERMLARLEARVFITVDRWEGHKHAAMAAEFATRLPALRHRVVLGQGVKADEVDFVQFFQQIEHRVPPVGKIDPDRVATVWFTSGTSGEPKAVLHTHNTVWALARSAFGHFIRARTRAFTPQSAMHAVFGVLSVGTLSQGATVVMLDRWDPRTAVDVLDQAQVAEMFVVPSYLEELLAELRDRPHNPVELCSIVAGGTLITPTLVAETAKVLGLQLWATWAMTEAGALHTDASDPPEWAGYSVGRPTPDTEIELRPVKSGVQVSEDNPGRLFIRGPGVCLATIGRDTGAIVRLAERDNGWYDTGDLATPDGRGGYRLAGRAADRIGGAFMIPVADVEEALRAHPDIVDVAIVGYRDATEGCAVLVTRRPLSLRDVHDYLRGCDMTEWYWPTRMERVQELPRNLMGKVEKARLRAWLAGEAELPGHAKAS
jgi:cyclohexanecarboxylate-CoA ligase